MTYDETIRAALAKVATSVDRVAERHWSFAVKNGPRAAARARIDGAWLSLDAPLHTEPTRAAVHEWALLEWNATLDGGARLALPQPAGLRVCADVSLAPEVDVHRRIIEACAGFRMATQHLHGAAAAASNIRAETTGAPSVHASDWAEDLLALCRETGWPVTEREPGHITVDLEVEGAPQQAAVERCAGGVVAASVPVLGAPVNSAPAPAPCRRALAVLLVRMIGIIRSARAAVTADSVTAPRFEIVYAEPSVTELAHGFAGLSAACLFAAEAAVLHHDEAAARAYLRQWDDDAVRRAV